MDLRSMSRTLPHVLTNPDAWSPISDGAILERMRDLPLAQGVVPAVHVDDHETIPMPLDHAPEGFVAITAADILAEAPAPGPAVPVEQPAVTPRPPAPVEQPAVTAAPARSLRRAAGRVGWLACGAMLAALGIGGGLSLSRIATSLTSTRASLGSVLVPPAAAQVAPAVVATSRPVASALASPAPTSPAPTPSEAVAGPLASAPRLEARPRGGKRILWSAHYLSRAAGGQPPRYDESRDEDAVLPLDVTAVPPIHPLAARSVPAPAPANPVLPPAFRPIDLDDPFGRR